MYLTLIITFVLVLLVTIFGLQNGMPLEVKFIFWNLKTSLIAVIFGSSLVGGLIIAILTLPKLVTKHFNEKRLAKRLDVAAKSNSEDREANQTSPASN